MMNNSKYEQLPYLNIWCFLEEQQIDPVSICIYYLLFCALFIARNFSIL